MDRIVRNNNGILNHIIIAVNANLISTGLLIGGYFVKRPELKVAAWAGAVVVWGILAYIIKYSIRPKWRKVKKAGYYFILTWPFFWILEQRKRRIIAEKNLLNENKIRIDAEEKFLNEHKIRIDAENKLSNEHELRLNADKELLNLKGILEGWPAANIAQQIAHSESRKEGLEEVLANMDHISDRDLAMIIRSIQYYAKNMLESPENGENYYLFRELIERLSLYEPNGHTQTFRSLLWLLSDIYEMQPATSSRTQVQKDMIVPLRNVIWRVDEVHLNVLQDVIKKIMLDNKDEHDLAQDVLEMLLTLDSKVRGSAWQLVFDECKKRAFIFPKSFGRKFLHKLSELRYRVFWLDFRSLHDIWIEPESPEKGGLLISNQHKFDELCSKVFAPIKAPQHGRVFKRLKEDAGKAIVECVLPNGGKCSCQAESLSFRGMFSRDCIRIASERFKAKIKPLLEQNRQFSLTASVAKLHTDENGNEVQGRGIFFEEAGNDIVKSLYKYILQH